METAIRAIADAGAIIVDPANIPSDLDAAWNAELEVLLFEFKAGLNAYLTMRQDVALDREGFPLTLAGVIAFNEAHKVEELTCFGQDRLLAAEAHGPLTDPAYRAALETRRRLSGTEGIDRVLSEHNLDALVAPTGRPAWPIDLVNGDPGGLGSASPAARAGYPRARIAEQSYSLCVANHAQQRRPHGAVFRDFHPSRIRSNHLCFWCR